MQLTETARIRLLIDGKEAASELSILDSKYNDLIESRNKFTRGTAEWKEFNEAAKETKNAINAVRERMEVTNMTYNESIKYQKEIIKAMKGMVEGTDDYNKSAAKLKEVNTHLGSIRSDLNATHQEAKPSIWSNLGTAIKGAFVVTAILEFGKQVIAAGMAVFELTAKFEKYKTVLSNTLGGQQEAVAAMEMIKDIAATTPVSVDEMTESFVKMVNRGVKPSRDEIKNLADLAASQGKSFDQLTEAVLDAMMGEGERLKEFGVKMKKSGDDVTLNFKGQTVAVKNNEQAIYDAIVAMGDYAGVAGMTSEMSQTLEGRVSNLGDAWDFVQLKLGDKLMPIFVKVLELFADGVEWVSDFIDELGPLGVGFQTIFDVLGMVWDIGKALFITLMPKWAENTMTTTNVIKVLGTILATVATVIRGVFGTVQLLVDGFITLANASRIVGNILIGDFKGAQKAAGDLSTSWSTLKSNASKNFGGITDSFKKIWTDTKKDTEAAAGSVDMYGKLTKKTEEEITDKKGKEGKKQTDAKKAELKALQEAEKEQVKLLDKLWKEHLELMKNFDKQLEKERIESNKVTAAAIIAIEKNITKATEEEAKARGKIKEGLQNRIKQYHNEQKELIQKENEQKAIQILIEQEQADRRNQLMSEAMRFAGDILNALQRNLDSQMALATNAVEKAVVQNKQAWLSVADSALGALDNLANGNFVGAIVGGLRTVFTALNNWVSASARLEAAKLEDLKKQLKEAGEEFMKTAKEFLTQDDVSRIEEVYKSLLKISEIPPVRIDMGTSEQRLQQELRIGAAIQDNYETAVEKEEELLDLKLDNEQKRFDDSISKINNEYEAAIAGINRKYDWESQMANRIFDLQAIGIQRTTNADLLAFVTNQDSKLSLTNDYESRRAFIMNSFAGQIKDITSEMSQEEIDGINAATAARDEQLGKLEGWLSSEIQAVLKNEGQKRKEYSETDLIIEAGKRALEELSIQFAAGEIERTTAKNIELAAAEERKTLAVEAAEQLHKSKLADIDKAYNDKLVELGKAKDAALAESFKILNDIVSNGYDDMIAKALEAYNAGKITAEQYNDIANNLFNVKNMLGQIDWSKLTVPNYQFPNYDFKIPGFANGGIFKDSSYFENHGVLGGLSHNTPEGGNWVINPRNGKLLAKVEANEWIGVVSKNLTSRYSGLLSQLAQSSIATTGKPVYAANGFMGKLETPAFVSSSTMAPTFSMEEFLAAFAAQVSIMQNINENIKLTVPLLESVASSSKASAAKKLAININNIHEASDIIADINQRSSFRA